MLATMAAGASSSEPRTIIVTNSGLKISREQYRTINHHFIEAIDSKPDTLLITLKGPSQNTADFSRLKESYHAEMKVNGIQCVYHKRELPEFTPKTTQYNLSDSCVYITFEITPPFQTEGLRTSLSVFCILDSVPSPGDTFEVTPMPVDKENPIVEWQRGEGDLVCAQITCLPSADEVLPTESRSEANEGKLVILSSSDVTGKMTVTGVKTDKKGRLLGLNVLMSLDCVMRPDFVEGWEWPVSIRDAHITLSMIEQAKLRPTLYQIEYAWPEHFVNKETK